VKYLVLTISLLFILLSVPAQHPNAGIIIGTNLGFAKINTELTSNFKPIANEFNHKQSPAFDVELSKLILNHWEIGTNAYLTMLKGDTDDPQFSAEGVHPEMIDPITEPVEYINQLFGQKFFLGYYFRDFERYDHPLRLEPFLRIGGGYSSYTSEFKYIDALDDKLIFGKNAGRFKNFKLIQRLWFMSAGVRTYINNHLIINTTVTVNYSGYDFLDVVHNYNADGTHREVHGLFTEFKIGIFYHSNELGKHKSRIGQFKTKDLPFSGKK